MNEQDDSHSAALCEAIGELYNHFGCGQEMHPYIQAIGQGAGVIHVCLVRKPRAHEQAIPKEWQGYPVQTRVIGRITIGG